MIVGSIYVAHKTLTIYCFALISSGDKVNKVKPTLVRALENVVLQQITCGWSHSVALTSDGEVYVSSVVDYLL